jgi:hypothetical protein
MDYEINVDFTEWNIIVREGLFKDFGCSRVASEEE